jgi:putative acetyltransferase
MNITVERAIQPMPEVDHLIGELNDVLGAAYDGIAMGCGGVALFDDYSEIKRMYTRPAARGLGLAKALLCRIENEVRGANKSILRLETGTHQQEAIGLYERVGFRPRGPFGPYAAMPARNIETSLFFEKILP